MGSSYVKSSWNRIELESKIKINSKWILKWIQNQLVAKSEVTSKRAQILLSNIVFKESSQR